MCCFHNTVNIIKSSNQYWVITVKYNCGNNVLSRSVTSDSLQTMDCCLPGSSVHEDSPGKNTEVGCHVLLKGIFPTQG